MASLRLALAQVNPTLGDLPGNLTLVRQWTGRAVAAGADLVAFPEMTLTGYPVEDMALRRTFVAASRQAVDTLAGELADEELGHVTVVVGYLDADVDVAPGTHLIGHSAGAVQNCAAVIAGGRVVARYAKRHLPNYGVFDEYRIFVPGTVPLRLPLGNRFAGGNGIEIAVCEDIWVDGLIDRIAADSPDLLLVINASPYERNKDDVRYELCARRAAEVGAPLAYVNLVGGQDDLVFDGGSLVVATDGTVLARAPQFVEHLLLADIEVGSGAPSAVGRVAEPLPDTAEIWHALVLGLRDYAHKNGFTTAVLGLSGGIDSAVTAALACDALGPERVFAVSMPSRYSSPHSLSDAEELTKRTGCQYRVVPIQPLVESFVEALGLTGLAEENVQARVRGVILMGISNSDGHLVLAPGNKSELATGYSTIYGDAVGGFAPIKDVAKTLVWDLARWRNAEAERLGTTPPIPVASIEKAPSAELRPGQLDADSLPDYEVLDAVVDGYVTGDRGRADLVAAGFDGELVDRVVRLVDRAEWKRRQYPIGTKITRKAFGRDRRLPVTNQWREHPVEPMGADASQPVTNVTP